MRDASVRAKLAGLLIIPLVAVLVLASVRLADVRGRATDAARVADLTQLGTDLSGLTLLLHRERMAAAVFLTSSKASAEPLKSASAAVDGQVRLFREHRGEITDVPVRVRDRLQLIQDELGELAAIRTSVSARDDMTVASAIQQYGKILDGLSDYDDAVSQVADPGPVADGLRALAAFSRIESAAGDQEAAAYVVRATGSLTAAWQQELIGTQTSRQDALDDFRQIATVDQVGLIEATLANAAVARADGLVTRLTGPSPVTTTDLIKTYAEVLSLFRSAETQLETEVVQVAEDESKASTQRATLEFVVVLLVLLGAIGLAFYIGRNLHLSLRRLREGALLVAHRDLPEAVSQLQDVESLGEGGVDRIIAQTRDPIRLAERDEFGQVAEAFNMVHREAIRVAAEQAALRTSVSAMFLSLARRSQALVDRMIGELDQIERTEEDPKRLAKLFDLDHLATRMRRNDENLLVLAGADVGAPRREDALLIDALRAAQSEVEMYHRIEFGAIDTDVSVTAAAVNDVVRLIAELLDNATRFSPPTTVVMAHGRRSGDHAVVQVEDHGLGVSSEQLELINRRLAEPTEVDVSAFRLMGFAVIARLAARHGIEVRLLPSREGGTIAEITLPPDIVALPGAPAAPGRAASWTRPGPAPQTTAGPDRPAEVRPPIRSAPAPSQAMPRWAQMVVGPQDDLDLKPTPDRPPLPTRVPKPTTPELPSAPLFVPASSAAPVSAAPVSAAPVSAQPLTARPISAQPLVARPISAQPVSARPFSAPPVSAPGSAPGSAPVSAQPAYRRDAPVSAQPAFPRDAPLTAPRTAPLAAPRTAPQVGMPTAGGPVNGHAMAAPSAPIEAPIQVEMQHGWFEPEVEAPTLRGMPTAGYAPAPVSAAPGSAPPQRPAAAPTTEGHAVPRPRTAPEDRWRTAADEGWHRAMAAAAPVDAGITRTGLPKRIPQAQLIPGGVQEAPRAQNRRSPDDVRGLLSAYTRGVQRGRTDGVADSAAVAPQAPKENEQ
ncbi:sensor histidine kinase [Actinoplanes awajinensis]|uniref:sensor histidine kinase n=1 Tax=Actinoplanes awajinensis TaxID=135946 RepID=UPI001E492CB1|nr:sensor histidine kinase [Actinoplanes awajinensis]